MSCWNSEGWNNSQFWVHALSLVKWYLWLIPCNLSTIRKLRKYFFGGKKKARVHYKSDSATENCLIILLIKCKPEKHSFPSPRAQLGWQEFKGCSSFIKVSRYVLQYRQTVEVWKHWSHQELCHWLLEEAEFYSGRRSAE